MAEHTDVLIVGSGSAGLAAALWLAKHGVPYLIIERRDGPLRQGQADGVQCRTVEIFESFGLAEDLLCEAYHVLEVAFWSTPSEPAGEEGKGGIKRMHFAADTAPGLSHLPHVILNQARINALMIGEIERSGGLNVEYGCEVQGLSIDAEIGHNPDAHAVSVTAIMGGVGREYRAKYVLGCDGAHSAVRKALGIAMTGDSSDAVWGVMDLYPRTSFPDIRKKVIIHSSSGSLIIIPREGDELVRFYIEQPRDTRPEDITLISLQEIARRIFSPYTLEVAETKWWSAYSIGQRLADEFHKSHRVFLTGDACHTHSPKAGQGMNVSLQDGYNIGWKLGAVLKGRAHPKLLETYVSERQMTATKLIDFDRLNSKMFSSQYRKEHNISPEDFKNHFVAAGQYTAGLTTGYGTSLIAHPGTNGRHAGTQNLVVGTRFPSAQVVRFSDAKVVQLMKVLKSDCRWRLIVFAGDLQDPVSASKLEKAAAHLSMAISGVTPAGADPDSIIETLLVLKSNRTEVSQEQIPSCFWPATGKWKIKNLHKVFIDDESYNSGHGHAYQAYGIDPQSGILVVVRPDQHIAWMSFLEELDDLEDFFDGFFVRNEQTSRIDDFKQP